MVVSLVLDSNSDTALFSGTTGKKKPKPNLRQSELSSRGVLYLIWPGPMYGYPQWTYSGEIKRCARPAALS
jgi:hypothetical protein